MSDALKKWSKHKNLQEKQEEPPLSSEERRSLQLIRQGAKKAGSFLRSGGKGGLPPSLVLAVMRRDNFKCKVCGQVGDKEKNGGLEVHHKSGIIESKWASQKGHANDKNNIVSICHSCHDKIHTKAREEGTDSSQVLAKGDIGTKHDHGQPLAHPKH